MKNTPNPATGTRRGRGRPSEYTAGLGAEILRRIALGETLTKICRPATMPDRTTVWRWAEGNTEFCNGLAQAREFQTWSWADESVDIADAAGKKAVGAPGTGEASAKVQAEKMRVDVRRWLISKLNPKQFGDKVSQEISGPNGKPIQVQTSLKVAEEIAGLVQDLREKIDDPEQRTRILTTSSLPTEAVALALRFAEGAEHAAKVEPPASWRGHGSEE